MLQSIGIVMDIAETERLRAHVPSTERIVLVAADRDHPRAVVLDDDAADRFAQIARTVMELGHGRHRSAAESLRRSLVSGQPYAITINGLPPIAMRFRPAGTPPSDA